MASLIQVIYASAATSRWTPDALLRLLRTARRNNGAVGITGFLGHNAGTFLQMLEGTPEAVDATLARIARDGRHQELTILLRRETSERFFPDWSMGFEEVDDVIPGPGLSPYLPRASTPSMWSANPDASLAFFELCRPNAEHA